jgi:hypothetical protein
MLSKLATTLSAQQSMMNVSSRAFRTSVVASKKPSIGDAVTILQSKVSAINQVVSTFFHMLFGRCKSSYSFKSVR